MVARTHNQLVTPQKCCDEILRCIRSSNLHFTTQETPYSLYVTVRKKMINEQFEILSENEFANYELLKSKERCDILAQNNDELRNTLELKDKENENYRKSVHELSLKLEKAEIEIQEAITEKNVANEKLNNLVQTTNKVEGDLIRTKTENDTVRLKLKDAQKLVKSKEREELRMNSKIDNLEAVVKNLKQENKEVIFEKNRISKEKIKLQKQILKSKERTPSTSKSTSTAPEYSSEASTSTVGISPEPTQIITSVKHSQTEQHPDIPYRIDTPLPPIFSSSLVHRSKPGFIARSHPNLATIRWRENSEDDMIIQEIEDIEMQRYDQEIQDFFEEATEKSRNLRQIYEDQEIKKLFDE